MRKIIDKIRRDENQMALGLLDDEASSNTKPPSEKGKDMQAKDRQTTRAVAQVMERSEDSSPEGTTNQPLPKPSKESLFFSRRSSWA